MSAPKIDVRDLSVFYGKKQALFDVGLAIRERRVMALIGPSGCGKSTFLRALNRMHDLSEGTRVTGSILLDGENLLDERVDPVEVRRRIGMVFQRPNPFPKSIFDNVAFGLRVAKLATSSDLAERVEESLRSAALWEEVKDRLAESAMSLSGGQQQLSLIHISEPTRPY